MTDFHYPYTFEDWSKVHRYNCNDAGQRVIVLSSELQLDSVGDSPPYEYPMLTVTQIRRPIQLVCDQRSTAITWVDETTIESQRAQGVRLFGGSHYPV